MAEVRVHIGDHEHLLACDDGQEDRLQTLAEEFDSLVTAAKAKHEGLDDRQAVLIAALALLDEYDESKAAWASATPEGKAAEWAAAQLDRASERLEKALGPEG
ncbi:MAG: cell division protein ZapA [Pseudomonadota bacterium]